MVAVELAIIIDPRRGGQGSQAVSQVIAGLIKLPLGAESYQSWDVKYNTPTDIRNIFQPARR